MAPSAADPRQILVVCNDARRTAFYSLVESIISSMRSELDLENLKRSTDSKPEDGRRKDPDQAGDGISNSFKTGRKKSDAGASAGFPRELVDIRNAALHHFDDWRKEVLKKLKEITSTHDDKKILEARRQRQEEVAKMRKDQSDSSNDASAAGTTENSASHNATDVAILQQHYRPVSTRLTTVPIEDRRELLSCMLLIMLSTGSYSAYSRTLALHLTSSLELPLAVLITEETEIAKYLVEASTAKGKDGTPAKNAAAASTMSADAEAEKRRKENQTSRFWKVGLASVAGAAVIGVTGGLAAPIVAGALGGIMGSVGLGGVASFLGIFWANGALVGTLFGAYGAKMTGEMMDAYAKEVNDFKFIPLKGPQTEGKEDSPADKQTRRLRVTIGINGWLRDEQDVTKPWEVLGDESEVFALRYEMKALIELGNCLDSLVSDYAWKYVKSEILKRTVLASVQAIMWPVYLLKTASNIDNPFNLARNRSEKTGRVLADALINRAQGERPVTLVGYSLGARAIHSCLRTLAERRAFGLVDNVVLIGAPTPSDTEHWALLRSVVAGRVFNVYSENDYILGFLYRATSLQFGIAGLQPVKGVPGLENLDLSDEVAGHLRYPGLIAQILTRCGFPDVRGDSGDIEQDEDIVRKQRGELDDEEIPEEAKAVREETKDVRENHGPIRMHEYDMPIRMQEDDHGPIRMHEGTDDEGPPPPLPKRRPVD
jgi:uncharacterized protein DUF726